MAVPFWGFSAPKLNIAQSVTQDLSDILQYLQFTPNWNVICTVTIILLNILMKSITTRRNQ